VKNIWRPQVAFPFILNKSELLAWPWETNLCRLLKAEAKRWPLGSELYSIRLARPVPSPWIICSLCGSLWINFSKFFLWLTRCSTFIPIRHVASAISKVICSYHPEVTSNACGSSGWQQPPFKLRGQFFVPLNISKTVSTTIIQVLFAIYVIYSRLRNTVIHYEKRKYLETFGSGKKEKIHNLRYFSSMYFTNSIELRLSSVATSYAALQEISSTFGKPNVHYRVHKNPPLVLILSQLNPGHNNNISPRCILILSTHLRNDLSSDLLPSCFPFNNNIHVMLFHSFILHVPSILFDFIILIILGEAYKSRNHGASS
jgi:hypothetical protein